MPRIKISEILALQKRRTEINNFEIEDIEFIDDTGNVISIDHEIIDDFRFTGLSNIDFIITNYYKGGFKSN